MPVFIGTYTKHQRLSDAGKLQTHYLLDAQGDQIIIDSYQHGNYIAIDTKTYDHCYVFPHNRVDFSILSKGQLSRAELENLVQQTMRKEW